MSDAVSPIQSALVGLLCEHDLEPDAANGLAGELIRDYPLVRRRGLREATERMCAYGMRPAEAPEAALELLAFELLGRHSYEQVLEAIGDRCEDREPAGVCLRAARLRREVTREVRIHEPRPIGARLVRLALSWLGTSR